jgi:hypothetical protein
MIEIKSCDVVIFFWHSIGKGNRSILESKKKEVFHLHFCFFFKIKMDRMIKLVFKY